MARRIWADGQPGNTPLTAARLNQMEDDIEQALLGAGGASAANVLLDTDGTPFFELGAVGGPAILADTDGVPYFN